MSPALVRILILVSGVLGVVLPNISQFGLPVATQATISGIGGTLLAVLAYLEHPTTVTRATKT